MRKLLGVLLIMLLAVAVLPARDLDGDSPTNDSTEGRFSSDFDNYLSTTDWSTLESNVLFLQFGAPEADTDVTGDFGSFQFGNGYFLGNGMYLGGFLGLQLPDTDAENQERVVDNSEIIISEGQPVGVRETVENSVDEVSENDTQFDILFGLPVGDIAIGIKNEFRLMNDESVVGTVGAGESIGMPNNAQVLNGWWLDFENPINDAFFNLDYSVDRVGPVSFNSSQTSRFESVSQDGTVTYENAREYADDGFINDKGLSDTFTAGANLPLGSIDLDASLGFGYSQMDMSAEGSETNYERDTDSGLPDYQGLSGVISYDSESGEQTVAYQDLSVPVSVSATLPVGEMAEFSGGVDYTPHFRLYDGDEVSQSFSVTEYDAAVDGSFINTTLVERELDYASEITDTSHTIAVPLSVTVTPNEQFRFSVRYRPQYGIRTVEATSSLSITETTTTDQGDPEDQDTVVVENYESEGREEAYDLEYLAHEVNLGAQFYLRENFRVNMGTLLYARQLDKVEKEVSQSGETTWSQTTAIDGGEAEETGYDYAEDIDAGVAAESETDSEPNGRAYVRYSIGFTYFFNEAMELDVQYSPEDVGVGDNGNIWDLGTWSALMTIRY